MKLHFVAKAQKDNSVAKKGESYYWWKPSIRHGKCYSKERPSRSQLTTSDYLSRLYEVQDAPFTPTIETIENTILSSEETPVREALRKAMADAMADKER